MWINVKGDYINLEKLSAITPFQRNGSDSVDGFILFFSGPPSGKSGALDMHPDRDNRNNLFICQGVGDLATQEMAKTIVTIKRFIAFQVEKTMADIGLKRTLLQESDYNSDD